MLMEEWEFATTEKQPVLCGRGNLSLPPAYRVLQALKWRQHFRKHLQKDEVMAS